VLPLNGLIEEGAKQRVGVHSFSALVDWERINRRGLNRGNMVE
jgi:hypothetical protein